MVDVVVMVMEDALDLGQRLLVGRYTPAGRKKRTVGHQQLAVMTNGSGRAGCIMMMMMMMMNRVQLHAGSFAGNKREAQKAAKRLWVLPRQLARLSRRFQRFCSRRICPTDCEISLDARAS